MIEVHIKRGAKPKIPENNGNFGELLVIENKIVKFKCYTGELPWRLNKIRESCIPVGTYIATAGMYHDNLHYLLQSTTPREGIFIHSGAWCGDKSMKLKTDTKGCIILGENILFSPDNNQYFVSNGRVTLDKFHYAINGKKDEHSKWNPIKVIIT